MNLSNLFEIQRKLDAEIEEKHPTLPGEDRLAKRILALQVELGECANEWRGFKFWSVNQSPKDMRSSCRAEDADYFFCGVGHEKHDVNEVLKNGTYCEEHGTFLMPMKKRNLLLEEYVDCLHFILSIGLGIKCTPIAADISFRSENIEKQFRNIFYEICSFDEKRVNGAYYNILSLFKGLGEMLGFTWTQIEEAYMSKNKTNWERQANGY